MTHIESDFLAYLDGELSPAETQAVEAHLATCPDCLAELRSMQALRSGLNATVPPLYQSVHLSPAASERIRATLARQRGESSAGSWWDAWVNLLRPLGKAAIPLVAVFFVGLVLRATQLPLPAGSQQTLVFGQDTLAPGSQAGLRVLVNNPATNQPVANAAVKVTLRQAGLAKTLYTGATDATGSAPVQFAVPADWSGDSQLEVTTQSELGQDQVLAPIRLVRSYRLLLGSDKPVYQPAETIHLRTLALSDVDSKPAANAVVHFEVSDSLGRLLLSQDQLASEFGIAAIDLPLAADAALGQYQISASLGDTVSRISVTLGEAAPPSFLVEVQPSARFYQANEPVTGEVKSSYFFGKPVAPAQVTVRLVGFQPGQDSTTSTESLFNLLQQGETDASGAFRFDFALPELPASAYGPDGQVAMALEATVTDASGDAEFGWQNVTLASQPLVIEVTPEDGVLRAGVENLLYILVSTPDGQPAEAELGIQFDSGLKLTERTNAYGLAQVSYTPRDNSGSERGLTITATDDAGHSAARSAVLPLDEAQQSLLLRTERALYRVGDTLAVEAIAARADVVYLDVIKGGQTLLTETMPVENGRARLAIDLTPELAGALELNAYQLNADGTILRDTRVVLVDAPEALQVQLATDREDYRPGQQAQLDIATTAGGAGEQTAVGLAVVNESVYAQREYQPGFARAYFLLDQKLEAQGVALQQSGLDAQTLQDEAQQLAAKASWARYTGQPYTLSAQSQPSSAVDSPRQREFNRISQGISITLLLASLAVALVVLVGLGRRGSLGKAAGRLILTLLLAAVLGAGLLFVTQRVLEHAPTWVAWLLLALVGTLALALLLALGVYGLRRRDHRAQTVALLLLAYAVLLALLVYLARQGATLSSPWLAALALGFGATLVALLLFGWGLHVEGHRRAGVAALVLGLLILPLTTIVTSIDFRGSELIQQVTGPAVYGISTNWLAGCAAPQMSAPQNQAASVAEPTATRRAMTTVTVEMEVEKRVTDTPQVVPTLPALESAADSAAAMATVPVEGSVATELTSTQVLTAAEILPLPAAKEAITVTTPGTSTLTLSAVPPITVAITASETTPFTMTAPITTTVTATPTLTAAEWLSRLFEELTSSTPTPTEVAASAAALGQGLASPETPTPTPTDTFVPEPTATLEATATSTPEPTLAPEATATPEPAPTATAVVTSSIVLQSAPVETATPEAVARQAIAPSPPLESLPIIRQRFPQTLYWNPQIVTDARAAPGS